MKGKIKRLIYIGALIVLIAAGIIVWFLQVKSSETEVFTIEHKREVSFQFKSKFNRPDKIKIRFEGKVDCDALLVLKDGGTSVKSRTTFPLKAGDLKEKVLECKWTSSEISLQLLSKECEIDALKVILEVIE